MGARRRSLTAARAQAYNLAISFCYVAYNLLLHAGLILLAPIWAVRRLLAGRYRGQLRARTGSLPAGVADRFGMAPAVWIHAASAGETVSAVPLVLRLKEALPDRPFFFTVTSGYGLQMAQKQLGDIVDAISFSPFDSPLFYRRLVRRINPMLYVMVETDLWPNLVRAVKVRGARVAIASGHAGPRTFPRPFWRRVLGFVDLLCMQTETDAKHIVARGAAPERTKTTGNLKFDSTGGVLPDPEHAALRAELGFPPEVPVFVAGSTLAEDEGPVLDAIRSAREGGIDLHAVIAPRRQERVAEVVKACAARGVDAVRRTQGGSAPVLILDTMGELATSYNIAAAAYVGGGLTPDVGLHNLLEPLVCGAPVLFGPHHGKAHRIAAEFLRVGAGIEISAGGALADALLTSLTDEGTRARLRDAGRELIALNRGAADRQAREILGLFT